jgi:pimeloyl-ACP methyl ester carboxylesterase
VPRNDRPRAVGPLLPDWSADRPVILVGHSAGAHTCLALQRLLRDDHFGGGSNADWVEAVICISGVLNGSTLAYKFGCDPATGVPTGDPERLIGAAVEIANRIPALRLLPRVEPWLEQWPDTRRFVRSKDNLAYDLSLTGCGAANASFSTNPNTYYLSLVTSVPDRPSLFGFSLPPLFGRMPLLLRFDGMNPVLKGTAAYQADIADFAPGALPLPNWGKTPDLQIDAWRENDGAVSEVSQHFPFTHHAEPFGGERIFDGVQIQKGKWYFERVENIVGKPFDHLDPGFGAKLKPGVADAQRELYRKLAALL